MRLGIFLAFAVLVSTVDASVQEAEKAHHRALELLAGGDASGAELAAREALSLSQRFVPEQEIGERPEKGILFEDMIAEARLAYRSRRASYFLTLGRALNRKGQWAEARKALSRASQLTPSAEPHLVVATQPDLKPAEKVRVLLEAFFAPDADRTSTEKQLMATGAFLNRNALQALVDQKRLHREVVPQHPSVAVGVGAMPEVRVATTGGMLVSTEVYRSGALLALYLPATRCDRCAEELDGIHRAIREARRANREVVLGMFVEEADLNGARRIARLLALQIEVGRLDLLPREYHPASGGEVQILAREGLLRVRIGFDDQPPADQIRQRVSAVLERIGAWDEVAPGDVAAPSPFQQVTRLESGGRSRQALLEAIEVSYRLEAGPASLEDGYRQLERLARTVQSDVDTRETIEILTKLATLRGAGEAKAQVLSALDGEYGQKLLDAVRSREPSVTRQARPDQGVFRLGVMERASSAESFSIGLQRSFVQNDGLANFNFVLEVSNRELVVKWVALESEQPDGTAWISDGAVFFFTDASGCRGLRLVREEGVAFEGCPVRLVNGEVVEERQFLVDSIEAEVLPAFYRRGTFEKGDLVAPESPLEKGLRLFQHGQYRAAQTAFEEAVAYVDPLAPYDEVDLRYNRARCLEELGRVPEALTMFRSVGDVAYQSIVDERIRALEYGGRR